jgi:nucleotide-binding universal stress UspA family protein
MECPEIKRILFATDESEDAHYAFSYALCYARQFNAKVTLLHVIQDIKDMVAFDFGIERSVAAKKWFTVSKEYFEEIKAEFAEIAQKHYSSEFIDDVVIEKGNPVKMILSVAKDKKSDLIVMGSKGRGSLEDAMMGNTVVGVLRRSDVPVLVIRQKKKV